ncbi:MAG: LptA/OstA family protein [Alphaproteobacteria bacterium]
MRLLLIASVLCGLAVAPMEARAEDKKSSPMPPGLGGGGPLDISAQKSLEYHQNEHVYLARGAAKATRGEVTITAEELAAHERKDAAGKSEIYKLTARQDVVIATKQQQIFGDDGIYDADKRVAVLTGKNLRFVGPNETITARDSLEYWQDKQQAIARGHAVAVRDRRRVEADRMIAQFHSLPDGSLGLHQLTAEGNIVITTDTDVARGDRAVYDMNRNMAILSGNVRVTRGASQLNGTLAEVDFKTGISRMSGSSENGRVQALFVPDANTDAKNALALPVKQP